MTIFFNISHPAHFHFFKNTIRILREKGHNIIIGARNKEFTIDLLKSSEFKYTVLTNKGNGLFGLIKELIEQQIKISKVVRHNSIDIMLQINGIFNAPIGRYNGIPTLAFSDTENDKWANKVSFSLSRHVLSPTCFDHEFGGLWKNQIDYPGYHELAYLAPRYVPERTKPGNNILIRFVGWGAGHDIGEKSLSDRQKIEITSILKKHGEIVISSEAPLPEELGKFAYSLHPDSVHDFMGTCKMVVGESATMASEAACLGIPAVFISDTGRGYTTEQDDVYGLVKHFRLSQWADIIETLEKWASLDLHDEWQEKRWNMLKNKIDVTAWMVDLIENFPDGIDEAKHGNFDGYYIKCVE